MFSDVRNRVRKVGQPPGTPLYTGKNTNQPRITLTNYSASDYNEVTSHTWEDCLAQQKKLDLSWINIEGLSDITQINNIAEHFHLHPLTVEDILNVQQRPKIEEFDDYLFVILKTLSWNTTKQTFSIKQISFVLGENYVLSFQEVENGLFKTFQERMKTTATQRSRQQGTDYLLYRLIDTIIDQYFIVLEGLGEEIEKIEEHIVSAPTPQNSRVLYKLKRQMLLLRKSIWPIREVMSHLLQAEERFITAFTRVYFRDCYDHTMQAIDTIETFRDMLSSMLDVYLSSLTNRMNEVMKTLTIIATIFMPISALASIYGMNFIYMPELHYKMGYPIVIGVMILMAASMLTYFRIKKWW
jgi:magnesium transporter